MSVVAQARIGRLDRPIEPQPPGTFRCLIVGAGAAGRAIARDLRHCPEYGLWPIGFVDDGRAARGAFRLPVVGGAAELDRLIREQEADAVVIAIPSLSAQRIRQLAREAARSGAMVRFLPSFGAAIERDARVHDLRHLRINELLGRPERHVVRPETHAYLQGRRVLVTGAGGSIGSELCRQLRSMDPSRLYLLDHDETNLQRLQLELTGESLLDSDDLVIADVRDRSRMAQLFAQLRPEVVFHAAAHKHLPLLERHVCEGVKSNVLGTLNVAQAALEARTERLILISTDKAADPSSVLGATKRIAEMVLQAHSGIGADLSSVRFGNVLGSRGSLLSILAEQIENGDEITITDPLAERYFMTIEEAAGLVVEAGSMADGATTFVLDMGEPVLILDLLRGYARQFNLDPDRLPVRYTGLRPGEKLRESVIGTGEHLEPTPHPKVRAIVQRPLPERFSYHLDCLLRCAADNRPEETSRYLHALIPEYLPAAELVSSVPDRSLYADDF